MKNIRKIISGMFLFCCVLVSNQLMSENYQPLCAQTPPPVPANDLVENAIPLAIQSNCNYVTYSNVGATETSGVPAPNCAGSIYKDVWFSIIVPANGSICIDTQIGSLTDCGMAIYSGTISSLTLIGCDDDSSPNGSMPKISTFQLTPGSTIYVRLWDYFSNNEGTFGICVTSPNVPTNCGNNPIAGDNIATAPFICNINQICGTTSNSYTADIPGNLDTLFCGSIENNSWFKFVADSVSETLQVNVSNCVNGYGIQMQVFGTSDFNTFVAHSNCWNPGVDVNGTVTITGLIVGETYYIMIDGNSGDVCNYSFSLISGFSNAHAGPDVTICSGQSTTLSAVGGTSYQWSPTTGLSNPNITNPVATPSSTTTYTVIINSQSGCPDTASTVVNVNTISNGGAVIGGLPICSGNTSGILTLINYVGDVLKWQKSESPFTSWTDINNTTSTYVSNSLTQTTHFRAVVQCGNSSASFSNETSVVVDNSVNGGALTTNLTQILLGDSTGVINLTGNSGAVVKWQRRLGSGTWNDIVNSTSTYSEIPNIVGFWEYRAVVNGTCGAVYSTTVIIEVLTSNAGAVTSGNSSICIGSSTGIMTLAGYSGIIDHWQKRLNSGSWTDFANTNVIY